MNEARRRRNLKWLILGFAGLAGGILTIAILRSIPMASGTAAATIVALIALKHLGLFVAVGSPLTALLQFARPRLLALCGRPPDDGD
jgi:hypothetical protein